MGLLASSLSVSTLCILPEVLGPLESVAERSILFNTQFGETVCCYHFRDRFCFILPLLLPGLRSRVCYALPLPLFHLLFRLSFLSASP